MAVRTLMLGVGALALAGCSGMLTPPWGVQEGHLAGCQELRGCVSSQASDPERRIEPIEYETGRQQARQDLLRVIREVGDAQVVSSHASYLRVEFAALGDVAGGPSVLIIDVAEFYFPVERGHIEVRSTPRRNMPDSGENRSRIEAIRAAFTELQRHRPRPR